MSQAEASPTEFVADVEGIGQFVFARRTMRLEIKSKVEFRRLTEGVEMDEFSTMFLVAIADLKTLTVEHPKGWSATDLDAMDPFDDAVYGRVLRVWGALQEKELPFRSPRA